MKVVLVALIAGALAACSTSLVAEKHGDYDVTVASIDRVRAWRRASAIIRSRTPLTRMTATGRSSSGLQISWLAIRPPPHGQVRAERARAPAHANRLGRAGIRLRVR